MKVLVVGTGRSGTSTVARVLHNHLNINMGNRFRDPDISNSKGYWEDLDFKEANEYLLDQYISFAVWSDQVKKLIRERNNSYENWGFKDPRLCYLLGLYMTFIKDPIIIRCKRDEESIIKSLMKNYKWSSKMATEEVQRRNHYLDNVLVNKNPFIINFSRYISDEELIERLNGVIKL